jgi:MFS transporter, SHS family, lactate transporter
VHYGNDYGFALALVAGIAVHYGNDYGFALALVAGIVAIVIVILAAIGVEAKGAKFGTVAAPEPR